MNTDYIPTNGTPTSDLAAESMRPTVRKIRERVADAITSSAFGMTCDEIEQRLALTHQTASARVYDLRKLGAIRDSGFVRHTRSGRKAIVWVPAATYLGRVAA